MLNHLKWPNMNLKKIIKITIVPMLSAVHESGKLNYYFSKIPFSVLFASEITHRLVVFLPEAIVSTLETHTRTGCTAENWFIPANT